MTPQQVATLNRCLDDAIALGENRVKERVEDVYWSIVAHRIRSSKWRPEGDVWWDKWLEKRLAIIIWG